LPIENAFVGYETFYTKGTHFGCVLFIVKLFFIVLLAAFIYTAKMYLYRGQHISDENMFC